MTVISSRGPNRHPSALEQAGSYIAERDLEMSSVAELVVGFDTWDENQEWYAIADAVVTADKQAAQDALEDMQ